MNISISDGMALWKQPIAEAKDVHHGYVVIGNQTFILKERDGKLIIDSGTKKLSVEWAGESSVCLSVYTQKDNA